MEETILRSKQIISQFKDGRSSNSDGGQFRLVVHEFSPGRIGLQLSARMNHCSRQCITVNYDPPRRKWSEKGKERMERTVKGRSQIGFLLTTSLFHRGMSWICISPWPLLTPRADLSPFHPQLFQRNLSAVDGTSVPLFAVKRDLSFAQTTTRTTCTRNAEQHVSLKCRKCP